MMSEAAQRRFDVLVFWALDRFTREGALATLQHLNRLSSYGVGFRSFTEPYLTRVESSRMLSSRSLTPSQNKKGLGYRSGFEQG